MPWLLWGFDRQTWPERELVIVDSSARVFKSERSDVRVIRAEPGSSVAAKRNLALQHARGEFVAWFDDDDWQHLERLERLVHALDEQFAFAGGTLSWFVDLLSESCCRYSADGAVIFNTALFRTELARSLAFDEHKRRAADTLWMYELYARHGQRARAVSDPNLMLWLCHDNNLSNQRKRRDFPDSLHELIAEIGPASWGDTDARLSELRIGLQHEAR